MTPAQNVCDSRRTLNAGIPPATTERFTMNTHMIGAKRLERAWEAFKAARDARDAAQREYDKAWAVFSELDDAKEAYENDENE